MTNKERELFEECKLQFIHIHNVIGRKQFSSTKNLIKAIDEALILPVVVKSFSDLDGKIIPTKYKVTKYIPKTYVDFG